MSRHLPPLSPLSRMKLSAALTFLVAGAGVVNGQLRGLAGGWYEVDTSQGQVRASVASVVLLLLLLLPYLAG